MSSFSFRRRVYAFLLGSLLCLQAQAVVVTATATDLTDSVGGPDRWRIAYRIAGAWPAFDTLTLFFPDSVFSGLTETVPAPLSLLASPSTGPGLETVITLTALMDFGPADSVLYSLDFDLLRALPFAPQMLEVATVDPDDFSQTIESRLVNIAIADPNEVPEPASWMLLGLGMALLRRKAARPLAH